MNANELRSVLDKHAKWLIKAPDGERANLRGADLYGANLNGANLNRADLRGANLRAANLSDANLNAANLSGANLRYVYLSGANLSRANLRGADLRGTNLSGAKGLLDPIDYIMTHFVRTAEGVIVYKTFSAHHKPHSSWLIEPGSVITETVNPNRTDDCGCGVNVATLDWVKENSSGDIWKCLIRWEWLVGVIVPFGTDGKIRVSRVQLLEIVPR